MNLTPSAEALQGELAAIPSGVTLTQLDNGLVIIIREDHTAPVVSAQAWCMAGSIHEGRWLGAGLSHVLEHMLFKGTTTRPGSRIDQEVQEAGGYMNAYTSFDRTVYHIDVPTAGAPVAIDILCDIMQNATLPADELEKEKQVIVREMDMNVDDPQRRASRRLFETAYTRSPYRYTVIGYPDIFNRVSHDVLRTYYSEKYAPNNVFFVIAGDVRAVEVREQIQKAYAGAKSMPMAALPLPEEPVPTGPREIIEEAPIEMGYTHFAWHIPDLRHPDAPALDVLAVLLGNGRSSRLYKEVRDRLGLAHSASAWTYSPGGQGLFGASLTLDPENFPAAKEALLAQISLMQQELVPARELSKAVKQFLSATLSSRKTMQGQAQDLGGSWISSNDLNYSERFLRNVGKVTAEDIRRVARDYLDPEKRTVYCLLPEGTSPSAKKEVVLSQDFPIHKVELENGLRLLVKPDHRLPFVELRAVLGGGVLAENEAINGATQLMGRMLLKGTRTRTADDLAIGIEEIGGSLDSYGGNNTFGVNAEVLSGDFTTGLELLADVLLEPAFPQEFFTRERDVQLAGIKSQQDHLLHSAFRLMKRTMFGPRGYGLDPAGSEESLEKLTRDDLLRLHSERAVPQNCVLSVFGDVDEAIAVEAVSRRFAGWLKSKAVPALAAAGEIRREALRVTDTRDKKQAVVVLGFPGLSLRDPRRYALDLLQEACSDLGSRLFLRIREELGLAYFVGAQNFVGVTPGYFAFYAGTMPEKASVVEEELKAEAQLLRQEGLKPEELKRAKAKLIGQRRIASQELGHLAASSALDELHGLGYLHHEREDALYEAVTLEQVHEAAREFLTPGTQVVSMVGQLPDGAAGA